MIVKMYRSIAKSVDRLERKKNREKRRRNEVNDRFSDVCLRLILYFPNLIYVAHGSCICGRKDYHESSGVYGTIEKYSYALRIVGASLSCGVCLSSRKCHSSTGCPLTSKALIPNILQILGCSATGGSPRPAQTENMKFPQQPMFMAAASTAHGQFWIPVGTLTTFFVIW